jgi:hypothetical protein
MKISVKQKIKGTALNTFNALSGKKGWRAAVGGGLTIAFAGIGIGVAVATAPLSGAAVLPITALIGYNAYSDAKRHDKKNGPKS